MWWKSALAFYAMLPAGATVSFAIFWRWFEYWRTHRPLAGVLVASTFALTGAFLVLARDWTFSGRVDVAVGVQVTGWLLLAVSVVFGTVADRQLGLRVRSFTPFFDRRGHLDLITSGAYGIVRHPIYSCGIVFQLGTFAVTGYPGVLVSLAIFGGGAVWFTRREEERLIELLDDPSEYERYRARVGALLPRLKRDRTGTGATPAA